MARLFSQRAAERYFIKTLNNDWNSLKEAEALFGSFDLVHRSLPTWAKNASPTSLIGPNVSIATEMNMWEEERAEYMAAFLDAAASAARPPPMEQADRYDVVKVSTTVASHARQDLLAT